MTKIFISILCTKNFPMKVLFFLGIVTIFLVIVNNELEEKGAVSSKKENVLIAKKDFVFEFCPEFETIKETIPPTLKKTVCTSQDWHKKRPGKRYAPT